MKEGKIEKIEKSKEEGMGKEKKAESKEAEKLPTIFMIYRDNDLFKEWIPKISETLKGLGRKVEIQSFPAGTEEEKIEKWVKEQKISFKGKEVITDGTVGDVDLFLGKETLKAAEVRNEYLDELLEGTTAETILGDEYEKMFEDTLERGGKSLVYAEKAIPTIVEHILTDKKNIPDEVVVSTMKIRQHAPLGRFSEDKAKEKVEEWLIEGGIPKEALEKKEECTEKKRSTIWYILDRHCDAYPRKSSKVEMEEWEGKEIKQIYLGLPLANFFRDAFSSGLLKLKPEELQRYDQILKERLKKDFGEKPEKEE